MLPDIDSARSMLNEMLRAQVDASNIQFLGKRGELPKELPEATVFQKTDIAHAAKTGIMAGGLLGVACGSAAVLFSPAGWNVDLITIPLSAVLGGLIGMWVASMVGSAVPNTKLKVFQSEIEQGKVLMMIDVSKRQIDDISRRVSKYHPQAALRGLEPSYMT